MANRTNGDARHGGRRADPFEVHRQAAERRNSRRYFPRLLAEALRLTWQADRRNFLAAAFLQLVGAAATSLLVVVGKLVLDAILSAQRSASDYSGLVPVIVLLAVVTAMGSASGVLQQQQQRLLSEEVTLVVWRRLLDVTGRVSLELYESPHFYDQLQRVRTNAVTRPIAVTSASFGLIGSGAATVGVLGVLLSIDPLLVPVLLLAGIPAVLLSRRASRLEFRFASVVSPVVRAREYLRQALTGRDEAKEVRVFGAEGALRSRHDDRAGRFLVLLRRHVRVRQGYALGTVVMTTLGLTGALALLVWFLALGRIGLADAGAAALGIRLLSSRLDQLVQAVGGLFESSVFLQDLNAFLGLAVVAETPGTGLAPPLRRAISVQSLSYTYPGSDRPVLHDIDLQIGAGEVVAIVGENGSGKTTLAKLIAGLYTPTDGTVWWDDLDTARLEPTDVRRAVAVIFQDFVRYKLTALENIGIGDPEHIEDETAALAAARQAGAAGFLEPLPQGYETILSKEFADGQDLSQGQWQRVALARALRRDASLVILDEPTSALDPRAEKALFDDVRTTLEGRSALLISHRYSTVRMADRIYVMQEGRIVEAGSHETLMATDGLYAELFSLQARAYT